VPLGVVVLLEELHAQTQPRQGQMRVDAEGLAVKFLGAIPFPALRQRTGFDPQPCGGVQIRHGGVVAAGHGAASLGFGH